MRSETLDFTKTKVLIIGAGNGGSALLKVLLDDPEIDIVGIADINPKAPGLAIAEKNGVKRVSDFLKFIDKNDVDVVMDVTNNKDVAFKLSELRKPGIEIVGGMGAKLMWQVIDERKRNEIETEKLLKEYQTLYELGLILSSFENLHDLFPVVVHQALKLTNSSAGSLAIFDEERGEMRLVAIEGFSESFSKSKRWKVRKNGLTSDILNKRMPTIISNVEKHPKFDNPLMIKEGIKSIAASPLFTEGKIVGILYVDDFNIREFESREISMLSLLSTLAALAIERAKLLEETRHLAMTDELTKLYNHRHFINKLNQEISRAVRYNRALSLAIFDIDKFKNYNDMQGHVKGNEVLKEVSRILNEQSREDDIVARYGGEEFVIIMPETQKKGAVAFSDRLRQSIADYVFENENDQPGGNLTVSGGVATCPTDAFSAMDLIDKADKALYKAKDAGRNKIVGA
jgi:diguanylate cyclase (GGDEF)-like protein